MPSIAVTRPHAQFATRLALLVWTGAVSVGAAQETPGPVIDGPPPPVAPATVARDALGRVTVRATRLSVPIVLDGVLDESVYAAVPAVGDFIQQLPDEGAAATERTEVWVFYDDAHVYTSARLWDTAPESEWVANDMRRDSFQIIDNDNFSVAFDTFYDRRNGVIFMVNPIAGIFDYQISDEGNPNSDWNPVWDVRTGRFDGGWTVEIQIPFKSIRYQPGAAQVWGFQVGRRVRRKNESSHLTPVSISAGPGMFRLSAAATLVGIEAPGAGPISKSSRMRSARQRPMSLHTRQSRTVAMATLASTSIRRDAEPDGRLHLQHRLRPGRGRRAASQPHAIQLVFSGKARVFSRKPWHFRFRSRRRRHRWRATRRWTATRGRRWIRWWRRRADGLLQPPDRDERRPSGADFGRCPAHRQGWRV